MTAVSVWTYPWDLHDIGLEAALGRLAAAGANMVSLATSYHAGRFLQPGNPRRRVYFPQDGTVYYRPDPTRWQGAAITPLMAGIVETEGDMLGRLIDRRDAGGPGVSCWTVCLHNTRLGMLHPGDVVRNAFGDPSFYALCPSSPAARAYVVSLCREIAEVYAPDRIELETPEFMGFSHGYHHEKDGLPLTADEDFLLGLCFCPHCTARATAAGVPVEEARGAVESILTDAFARELPESRFPDFPTRGIAAFDAIPALAAFLRWRAEPVTSLIAEIRAAVPARTQLLLIGYDGADLAGIDVAACAPHLSGVLYCGYFAAPERLGRLLAETRRAQGPDKSLIAGFQLFHPNVRGPDDLRARVAAARPHVDGWNFYNLGLVPPARLGWISRALA